MAKKIEGYIKLEIPAGQANPSPPVGPALGQRGLNIMEFCKAFNAATQNAQPGTPTPVVITAYSDRSFTFETKTPPASYFLRKAAGIPKGSTAPGKTVAGKVTMAQVRDRGDQDGRPQRQRPRRRGEDHRRLGPLHGPGSGGVGPWQHEASA